MPVSEEKARAAQEEFINKHYNPDYVNGCGIGTVMYNDPNVIENEQDDNCLVVRLCKAPPKGVKLPTVLFGVRIYYKVEGEIKPL